MVILSLAGVCLEHNEQVHYIRSKVITVRPGGLTLARKRKILLLSYEKMEKLEFIRQNF